MFDIITPCTRPNNLNIIHASILNSLGDTPFHWHVVFDTKIETGKIVEFDQNRTYYEYGTPEGVAGKAQINFILDRLPTNKDTWIYVLDDDNIMHPVFGRAMNEFVETFKDRRAVCMMQQVSPDRFRPVEDKLVKATFIDQAQYVVHRSLIGDRRFRQDYCGDGQFIEELHKDFPNEFAFLNYPACYYNYLRWAHESN